MRLRYADLICIGSQKAATTWLHRMLARHPRVFMPPLKEVHYFDALHVPVQRNFQLRRAGRARRLLREQFARNPAYRAITYMLTEVIRYPKLRRYFHELRFTASLWETPMDDAWYASLFEGARPDQVTCDFTSAYALLPPDGIAHLRRLNPEARVVFILRNPVDRALSHARMLVKRHKAPRTDASLRKFLDSKVVRSRDDSIAVLDCWQAHWPKEQFKVLFFDDIESRPLDVLADVCGFAGLDYDPRYFPRPDRVVYRGPSIPASDETLAMLRERFAPMLEELARRYPEPAARWDQPARAAAPRAAEGSKAREGALTTTP